MPWVVEWYRAAVYNTSNVGIYYYKEKYYNTATGIGWPNAMITMALYKELTLKYAYTFTLTQNTITEWKEKRSEMKCVHVLWLMALYSIFLFFHSSYVALWCYKLFEHHTSIGQILCTQMCKSPFYLVADKLK